MLKELSIRVYRDEKRPTFQFYSGGIEQLYLLNLGKVNLGSLRIINVYFTNQDFGVVNKYDSIIDLNVTFDFFSYEKLASNFLKKQRILEVLHYGLVKLAGQLGWNTDCFKLSFQKCIESNLSYNWFFKGRLFRSPDRKYYFGLWHFVDVGEYEIWEVLYDENQKEINRRVCFKDRVCTFFIDYASWEGQNNEFFYRFNGPKKKFVAMVEDLIAGKEIDVTLGSSAFFKE